MELFVGLLVLGLGAALVATGVRNRVPDLFATITGKGTGPDPTALPSPSGAAYLPGPTAGTTAVRYV